MSCTLCDRSETSDGIASLICEEPTIRCANAAVTSSVSQQHSCLDGVGTVLVTLRPAHVLHN